MNFSKTQPQLIGVEVACVLERARSDTSTSIELQVNFWFGWWVSWWVVSRSTKFKVKSAIYQTGPNSQGQGTPKERAPSIEWAFPAKSANPTCLETRCAGY